MGYRQDISRCLADAIGPGGLDGAALEAALERGAEAMDRLRKQYEEGSLPFLSLPERRDDLPEIVEAAQHIAQWPAVAVIGTGGSSLGGQCLAALEPDPPWPGLERRPAQCFFVDNIDPRNHWLAPGARDFSRASVIAISKSGTTMETIAQLLHLWTTMRNALGPEAADRFLIVTQPGASPMRRFADANGIRVLDHDPVLGGRYSVLSLVGLLPAVLAGCDPEAVRAGAQAVLRTCLEAEPRDNPPLAAAAAAVALMEQKETSVSVLCPYADTLEPFAKWYAQLWAESLGKDGRGSTPYPARGAVDQHSQLQLWLGGPRDKQVTVLTLPRQGAGARLPSGLDDPELAYLDGRTLGDVMEAEQRATIDTLARNGVPTRIIALDALDEETLGALFMHFEIETVLAGYMMGIDPFDQPAVEEGKVLARKYLSETAPD